MSKQTLNDHPLVTIGIPNYNYGHYLVAAMESVVAQSYPNIELIVVDDCSTDNSKLIIEDWLDNYRGNCKLKFIQNESNKGLSGTCNVILNNAKGIYFQTLDADDLIAKDKIYQQVNALKLKPETAFIYSNAWVMDEIGEIMETDYLSRINYNELSMPEGDIFKQLFEFNFIPLPAVLINTKLARECGGYDDELQVQDYYLWLKLSKSHPVLFLPGKSAYYRVHSNSMSNNPLSNLRSIDSVLKIKYAYFKEVDKPIQQIIKKNIHFSIPLFYEQGYKTVGLWLRRDVFLNPGIKSLGYYLAFNLGVPYVFFKKIKKFLSKN